MSSFVLSLKELESLRLSEAAAAIGVVLNDKIDKRLANGHTYLDWFAWPIPHLTAPALKNRHIGRSLQHQIPGEGIWNNLFYVLERNIVVKSDDRFGKFWCKHLPMIVVRYPLFHTRPRAGETAADQ
jgi:hypothetical protein